MINAYDFFPHGDSCHYWYEVLNVNGEKKYISKQFRLKKSLPTICHCHQNLFVSISGNSGNSMSIMLEKLDIIPSSVFDRFAGKDIKGTLHGLPGRNKME